MLKQRILLLVLMALSLNAFGQGTIKGRLVDAKDGADLVGATVVIKGTTKGTIANYDGTFSLAIPTAKATILFSYIGYAEESKEIDVSGGQTLDLGLVKLKVDAIGLEELKVVSSFARDRKTPVSFSSIKPKMIEEKLGSQEFPEILKTTPSVYATKQGGGYGDSRINLRGFSSENIGVLINGVPVNDMESGKVYWSNWAGLSDVTRTMQVQRGLGASKLAISSIGGTINIITKSTDAKKGGSVSYEIGNDNYQKMAFTVSTGMYENGWAVTASGSKTTGDGYIRGTNFEAFSYFLNIAKRISDRQQLSFTIFGAPQWHNQRGVKKSIEAFRLHRDGIKHNANFGTRDGEIYGSGYGYNEYHKPQMSLNHFLEFSDDTKLSTAIYASISNGGGRRVSGPMDEWLEFQYPSGEPNATTMMTPDGYLDYDAVIAANGASTTGSQAVISMSTNSHDWYGILSSLTTKVADIDITAGFDGRYYKGYHYTEIQDLLGGAYFLNSSNMNRDAGTPLREGDKIDYYNIGEALWSGGFLQAEYETGQTSMFLSTSLSNSSYRRTDYFGYAGDDQVTDWQHFLAYSIKGGVNYNVNDKINVYANGGYFTRAPFFRYAYVGYTNEENTGVKHERVLSGEVGLGYKSSLLSANVVGYYTKWMDKGMTVSMADVIANMTGLDAEHMGIEVVINSKPIDKLEVRVMGSFGDWQWAQNATADLYDETQTLMGSETVYADGLHVGDAAQTTASLSIDWEALPNFKVGMDFTHYDRLYAQFDIENRTDTEDMGEDPWKMPAYQLVDFNVKYDFKLAGLKATVYGKVNNLFDTEYIADGRDGNYHNAQSSVVYYGFGRTWTARLKIRF